MKKPNIILINCDDLGYGDLGCYGSTKNHTPAIDRLASEGIKFTSFYMASSVCSPSRGAMLTGCYPKRIGFEKFGDKNHSVLFPGDGIGLNPDNLLAYTEPLKLEYAKETTTICPYCAVGCGIICHSRHGKVINTEGDPDHPINEGTLCSKGSSLFQTANNDARLAKPAYRAPGAKEWKEVSWDWALDEIAKRIKKSRDASFVAKNDKGQVVNRTNGLASVGSAAMDNEECYVYQKFLRSLGLVYIEHQARI